MGLSAAFFRARQRRLQARPCLWLRACNLVVVFTTLAVAAKNIVSSVPIYLLLETGFTLLQFAIVGPLIALAHRN
jgi:hypothetical protein